MEKNKERFRMSPDMLDKVAGGAGDLIDIIPERISYAENPTAYDMILAGQCPKCSNAIEWVGSACYYCANCIAGFYLFGEKPDMQFSNFTV